MILSTIGFSSSMKWLYHLIKLSISISINSFSFILTIANTMLTIPNIFVAIKKSHNRKHYVVEKAIVNIPKNILDYHISLTIPWLSRFLTTLLKFFFSIIVVMKSKKWNKGISLWYKKNNMYLGEANIFFRKIWLCSTRPPFTINSKSRILKIFTSNIVEPLTIANCRVFAAHILEYSFEFAYSLSTLKIGMMRSSSV